MNETALKIAFPGLLFIFAAAIVVQALQMTGPLAESNAHLYPIIVASLLGIGAVFSMVGAIRGTSEPATASAGPATIGQEEGEERDHGGRTRVLVVLAASITYPVMMPVLGFHLTTVAYAAGLSQLLQERSWAGVAKAIATGVGVTLFCHVTFILVLDARLPSGVVF